MNVLQQIYENWANVQTDNLELKSVWCEIMESLYESCSEPVRETVSDRLFDLMNECDRQAFYAGFSACFNLFIDMMRHTME